MTCPNENFPRNDNPRDVTVSVERVMPEHSALTSTAVISSLSLSLINSKRYQSTGEELKAVRDISSIYIAKQGSCLHLVPHFKSISTFFSLLAFRRAPQHLGHRSYNSPSYETAS